jgi:hypothetical protein
MESYSYREGFPAQVAVIAENCRYEAAEEYLEITAACHINPFSRTSEVPNSDLECTCDFVKTNRCCNVCWDQ